MCIYRRAAATVQTPSTEHKVNHTRTHARVHTHTYTHQTEWHTQTTRRADTIVLWTVRKSDVRPFSVLLTWTLVDVNMGCWTFVLSSIILSCCGGQTQAGGSLKRRRDAIRQALNLTSHSPVLSTYRGEAPARGRPFFGTVTSAGGGKWNFSTGGKAAAAFKGHNNQGQISLKLWQPKGQNTFSNVTGWT